MSARLASIVESSDDAIISKDLDGTVTSWNVGASRIFGYYADEMIGQPITRIIPPELHNEEEEILARLKRGERIEHYETTRVAKDGSRLDISLTISPLRDKHGVVVGASKVARDVTERKRAEKLQRLLIDELNHRVKNTLAMIQAISSQSLRHAKNHARIRLQLQWTRAGALLRARLAYRDQTPGGRHRRPRARTSHPWSAGSANPLLRVLAFCLIPKSRCIWRSSCTNLPRTLANMALYRFPPVGWRCAGRCERAITGAPFGMGREQWAESQRSPCPWIWQYADRANFERARRRSIDPVQRFWRDLSYYLATCRSVAAEWMVDPGIRWLDSKPESGRAERQAGHYRGR